LPDDAVFCSSCGAAVVKPGDSRQQSQQGYSQNYGGGYSQNYGGGYGQSYVDYSDPVADARANKIFGIISYIGVLVFVTLLFAPKESRFSRFHGNQGLVLFLVDIAGGVALVILHFAASIVFVFAFGMSVGIQFIFGLLWAAFGVSIFVLAITVIVNAANNRIKPLPIIGKYTILK
jgi:uncharacterized membrane protein